MSDAPFWDRNRHADRRPALLAKGRIKRALRAWFEAEGFLEVECGALAFSPGNETHLHAFATELKSVSGAARPAYLHTSPEFAAKKLLAAGEEKIFEFARVFRNREGGPLHAPEFTMLEWYRAQAPYQQVISDALSLVRCAADTGGVRQFRYRERSCDPFADAEHLSVTDAFLRYAGIDLMATVSRSGQGCRTALAALAPRADVHVAADDTWSDIFSKILVACIEPNLGIDRLTVLDRYPRCEAALARDADSDPRVAERFELYACGVELANGFGELIDPFEQRKRFKAQMAEKKRIYGETYPIDEDFLAALTQMPPSSGVALGFERLAMLACGARTIHDVIWTPAP